MRNKKGLSVMIGYILLIAGAITMSGIVYVWLKSYVPTPVAECPEEVSLIITDVQCDPLGIKVSVKNNGRFNVTGYQIKATKNEEEKIATIEIASLNDLAIGFVREEIKPSETKEKLFPKNKEHIYSIEITPVRLQEEETGKIELVFCGNAKVRQEFDSDICLS